jgi:hypothetical protein
MWLASRPVAVVFESGNSSRVTGLVLDDGRRVVVRVRPARPRLQSCAYVQQHLWRAGFPCPEPLCGPVPYGRGETFVANADLMIEGGAIRPASDADAASEYATLLAQLIRLGPAADDLHALRDAPPWIAWDHPGQHVWPNGEVDAHAESDWLDEIGRAVRNRLTGAVGGWPLVIGHGDWAVRNVRWQGRAPIAVHGWDSVIAAPEPIVVGLAAVTWTQAADEDADASVAQTEAFLDAYQDATARVWPAAEVAAAWATGLWVRAFHAKRAASATLTPDEAAERRERAGVA